MPEPTVPQTSASFAQARERGARNESRVILDGSGWLVVAPQTAQAHDHWASGTDWERFPATFDFILAEAPVTVFVRPDGEKFITYGMRELRDAANQIVAAPLEALAGVMERLKTVAPALHTALWVRHHPSVKNAFEWELAADRAARMGDADALAALGPQPDLGPAPEAIAEAVRLHHLSLYGVPKVWHDRNACLAYVRIDGRGLGNIRGDLKDEEMCRVATETNIEAISHLPDNPVLIPLLLERIPAYPNGMRYLPRGLKTREVCMAALAADPDVLEHVPQDVLDEGMFLAMVRKDPSALKKIIWHVRRDAPDASRFLTEALFTEAVCGDGLVLRFVPPYMLTAEIAVAAVLQNNEAEKYIPESLADDVLSSVQEHGKHNTPEEPVP